MMIDDDDDDDDDTHCKGEWRGPHRVSDALETRKSLAFHGNRKLIGHAACTLVTIPTELSRLLQK
jgi:hypothetical protein